MAREDPDTSEAASPGRRGPCTMGTGRLVTAAEASITCFTEKPLPVPRLNCRTPLPSSSQSSPFTCASAKSITWT